MPNWVINTIYLEGIGKRDEFYRTYVEDGVEKKAFDFNAFIPEPKTEEECRSKYDGDRYIDIVDEDGKSKNYLMHDDDDKWFNWYKWHNDFWSTKWNACYTQILDDDSVKFDTAWNAPDPIFRELSRKYPGVVIDIFCDFEMGESYELKYLNGEQIDVQNVTLHFTEDTEEN